MDVRPRLSACLLSFYCTSFLPTPCLVTCRLSVLTTVHAAKENITHLFIHLHTLCVKAGGRNVKQPAQLPCSRATLAVLSNSFISICLKVGITGYDRKELSTHTTYDTYLQHSLQSNGSALLQQHNKKSAVVTSTIEVLV